MDVASIWSCIIYLFVTFLIIMDVHMFFKSNNSKFVRCAYIHSLCLLSLSHPFNSLQVFNHFCQAWWAWDLDACTCHFITTRIKCSCFKNLVHNVAPSWSWCLIGLSIFVDVFFYFAWDMYSLFLLRFQIGCCPNFLFSL